MVSFIHFATLASVAAICATALENAAVYRFGERNTQSQAVLLSQMDSIYNLADEFDVSDFYELDKLDNVEALGVGKSKACDRKDNNQLVIIVNGVDEPQAFFEHIKPVILVESKDDRSSYKFRSFLSRLPSQMKELNPNLNLSKLSSHISILGQNTNRALFETWSKVFHDKEHDSISLFWGEISSNYEGSHFSKRSLEIISDEEFINELTQLEFLLKNELVTSNDKIIVNLQSLTTIYEKTGEHSQAYQTCKKLLGKLIISLVENSAKYDSTVVVMPLQQQLITMKINDDSKQELSVAKRDSYSVFASANGCFSSQEDCLDSTSTCSGHGLCSKVGKCWKCVCSATQDSSTGRTTKWTGASCQKKDVSAETNLFLWTTVVLLFVFAAGVKLLISCGNEELPGVLIAATVPTKKTM
ncbi:hypothetical protein KL911_003790 [Ogataea haglerorum]|uniref:uncharacterized protein n=1 Tax=Ogataea haglerorum TaxID=1937702 RepID=UPI001C89110C|nr:uncharacterized protein KL911_003790 [Ogataea haglerorum]KAG7737853.1 hypothetical protein KL923_003400 [Ogataea haglerorum]KAG7747024.1 hypothetical protein KL912_003636 [Ogataea haglerorum]KAG7752508.1 hypothetical protein KL911_003790 [Ogataea haglerorum]KAG7788153.1 hypothetical protein KL945_002457 [Ogataea haglerorum]KAG7788408.1 hypothetical protein KL910_003036 [Ogataea haglerorum]